MPTDYFHRVDTSFSAVTWPRDQDVAPATLYARLKVTDSAQRAKGDSGTTLTLTMTTTMTKPVKDVGRWCMGAGQFAIATDMARQLSR